MARYKGTHNADHKWSSKTYVNLTQADIMHLSESDLKTLIKKEGKTANSRLSRMKKRGEYDSAIVLDKYKSLEYSTYGTKTGNFSLSTSGESIEELRAHFLFLRGFLSHNYTAEGMEEFRQNFAERTGTNPEMTKDVFEIFNQLFKEGYSWADVDSSVVEVVERELEYMDGLDDVSQELYFDELLATVRNAMDEYREYKQIKKKKYQKSNKLKRFKGQ